MCSNTHKSLLYGFIIDWLEEARLILGPFRKLVVASPEFIANRFDA